MSMASVPRVGTVLHAVDSADDCDAAFVHALAIALVEKATLTLLDIDRGRLIRARRQRYPAVRRTLERWGLLAPGSPRSAVFERLAMQVKKVGFRHHSKLDGIHAYLEQHPADLVVTSASLDSRDRSRRVDRKGPTSVTRRAGTRALVIPDGRPGFVDQRGGHLSLRRILIPVARHPDPAVALYEAARAGLALGDERVEITILHVGEASGMPPLPEIEDPRLVWQRQVCPGQVADSIISVAESQSADLIVMPTRGAADRSERFTGTKTEQVVARTPCPVLAVPMA